MESLSKDELMALLREKDGRISELNGEVSRLDGEVSRLDGEVARLDGEVVRLDGEVSRRDDKIIKLDGKIAELQAYILKLRQQLYGSKCERNLPTDPNAIQLTLDLFSDEENAEAQERLRKLEEEESKKLVIVPEHKRHTGNRAIDYSGLTVVENVIDPQEVLDTPEDYVLVGEESADTLVTEPKKLFIRRTIRRKYALKSNLQQQEDNNRKTMVIASWPKEVIFPGCFAEVSTLADLEIQKFFYHMPHYRVIQQYKEAGIRVSSSTVNDWHNRTCDLLHPLYNASRRHLMKSPYIHCDESAFSVYNEETHKVQGVSIWALSDALGPDVVFQYEMGKKNCEIARSIMKSYNGVVQTDASALYEQFEKDPTKVMLGCWIHCRRYFLAGMDEDESAARTAIAAINKLYSIEHDADIAGLSIDERKEKRQKEAYPIIKDLETWLYTKVGVYPVKSPMYKAVNYALTHMPKLARYVNDGRFRLDNNDIEEVIRPLKVGLNNYGYCHNHDAAYRSAMIYSFIASCNKADVNPREWMEDIMPKLKDIAPDDFASLEMLLPGEWKKTHPESHSMVHHTTEAEHVAAILKSRAKRKAAEQEAASEETK